MELSALQSEGKGEVVSSPRVITANAKEASIEQGVEIPYQQQASSGATNISFKKAVMSLNVTPQITPDERIIMDLAINKDSVGKDVNTGSGGTVPSIDTRKVKTQVLVDNGQTVVLGGIYEDTVSDSVTKVPLLGDLPLLGYLFRNTIHKDEKTELLIFITPKILSEGLQIKSNGG
jgi:type IV pilus assembly protein PilQ